VLSLDLIMRSIVVEVDAADVTPIRKSRGGREVLPKGIVAESQFWKPNSAAEVTL
jgi:hypothetical protein